jgi:protein TonB
MKNLKKLPTKQLEKFSNIFTQLGLVLVLFIVYMALEHKTEQRTVSDCNFTYKPEIAYLEPDTEVLFRIEPKVIDVPKIIITDVFIVDAPIKKGKDADIETIINLPKEEPTILNSDDIIEVEIPKENLIIEDVDFVDIHNAPVFKGCEGLNQKENKVCFDKKMKQFIHRNFDVELANELGLRSGIHRIQTQFLIDNKGNVVDVKIRAPHNQLKKEADRLIKKLPKFTPGKQRNVPVRVRYRLPIAFSVE